MTIGAITSMNYNEMTHEMCDLTAYKHWDTSTSDGQRRLSHLEIHPEQLSLMEKYLNQDMSILDLGCGTNLYKKYYPNILGVDVIDHPDVDVRSSILQFKSEQKFDAVLSLGSIQYFDYIYIEKCFAKMVDLVKSGGLIIFRALYREPSDHKAHLTVNESGKKYLYFWEKNMGILFFWEKNMIERLTTEYNLDIIHPLTTYPLKGPVNEKFYAVNVKGSESKELMNMTLIWRKL